MKKKKYVMAYMTYGGWYILQGNQMSVRRLDGVYEVIKPYHIVQRVKWMDTEGLLRRIWRTITSKVLIVLPSPGTRFALMDKQRFNDSFKLVQRPRSRWE